MNIAKALGLIIRRHRNRKNLTQEKLSQLSGVSMRHIQDIDAGKVLASISILIPICKALETPLHEMMKELEEELEIIWNSETE